MFSWIFFGIKWIIKDTFTLNFLTIALALAVVMPIGYFTLPSLYSPVSVNDVIKYFPPRQKFLARILEAQISPHARAVG